jgi:hypothetical protein
LRRLLKRFVRRSVLPQGHAWRNDRARPDLPNRRSGIRQWPQTRHELFHLALALMPRRSEKLLVVLCGEMRCQQPHGREVDSPAREHFQHDRELAGRTGRLNAAIRSVLRQMQHLRAVREQRRAALAQVQAPAIELRQVGNERRRCHAFVLRQALHLRE